MVFRFPDPGSGDEEEGSAPRAIHGLAYDHAVLIRNGIGLAAQIIGQNAQVVGCAIHERQIGERLKGVS